MNLEYKIVAFIDLLGFSEMVKFDCNNGGDVKFYHILYDSNVELRKIAADNNFWFTQFSDSIVISIDLNTTSLIKICQSIKEMQSMLFLKGILCRGAISFGKHFSEGNFLFSDGLINAYYKEKDIAKYPRVVIDQELLDLLNIDTTGKSNLALIKEIDDQFFINYLQDLDCNETKKIIQEKLEQKYQSMNVKEKIIWLAEYYEFVLGSKHPAYPGRFIKI